jgi:hypothetical protein
LYKIKLYKKIIKKIYFKILEISQTKTKLLKYPLCIGIATDHQALGQLSGWKGGKPRVVAGAIDEMCEKVGKYGVTK